MVRQSDGKTCPECGRTWPVEHWRKRKWGVRCNACQKRLHWRPANGPAVENDREVSRRWKRTHLGQPGQPMPEPSTKSAERHREYPLFWRVRVIRPEWYGRRCRIVIHGGKRGARLIEFEDGYRVVCPGQYLRRADPDA